MWMTEKAISKAMYEKCLLDDKKKYWQNITDPEYACWYCYEVKDRPEVRKYITGLPYSLLYYKHIGQYIK